MYGNPVKMDFSVNVNPLGIPESVERALEEAVSVCGRYPDIEARELKGAMGAMLGIPQEYLLFGNGASELLLAVIHGIKPAKTVIPVPSFYGYEYAAAAGGGEILYYETGRDRSFSPGEELLDVLTEDVGLLFLANPNNPTGSVPDREYLRRVLAHCRERGICVALDECFAEFCREDVSMLPETESFGNLILIRAFTKLFAIPGVRLGYLVCSDPSLRERIAGQLPEWNLSVFAQAAGCACARETEFVRKTRTYVTGERQFLSERLRGLGLEVFPGEANFLLVYSKEPLYEPLLRQGILIRDCGNFRGLPEGFFRVAVRTRAENEALLEALSEIIAQRGISEKEGER